VKSLTDIIYYLNSNLQNIEQFSIDFFNKKFTNETFVFSYPPLYKGIKDIDTIKKEAQNTSQWQCVFAKNKEAKIDFLPKDLLKDLSPMLLEVNFNCLQPNTSLPEHTDHFDRTIIHILLNDLDNDSYITLEGAPLYLRKKFDIVSFNYNKLHGATNTASTHRKTIAFLLDKVIE